MNVALLTLDVPPNFIGGVSAWAMDMAIALHRAGHTVTVYAKHTGDTTSHDAPCPSQCAGSEDARGPDGEDGGCAWP